MKRKWLWIGIGGVLTVLLLVVGLSRNSGSKMTPVQFADALAARLVDAAGAADGAIAGQRGVAHGGGKIIHLAVKEGDGVKKGDLLLQLDDTQYRASYQQAQAALASAQSRVREAESALRANEANFTRQRSLYEQKMLSDAEWDQATSAHESALSAVATSREEVSRARAMVDAAKDNVSKCRFIAPFDGVVSALNVEQGEIVILGTMNNPGTQILTVSDLSGMLVRADVDETDVVDLKLGQKAKITVDALPDTSFVGTVNEIGNTAKRSITSTVEGQTNFEVKVLFDDNVPTIRPGMTADVDIETAIHAKTLGVPIQAVVVRTDRELERASHSSHKERRRSAEALAAIDDTIGKKDKEITGVFVVKDGTAKFVPVRTGIASETEIEVVGDVKSGDTIVAGPYKALRELKPNSKVKQEQAAKGRK